MTLLDEMQFELLVNDNDADGYAFGLGRPVSVEASGFDPGTFTWMVQTQDNAARGGRRFGDDLPTAKTWGWTCFVDEVDVPSAVGALEDLGKAWIRPDLRREADRVFPLRYRIADRVRRVYGRPGRLAGPPNNRILSGYVDVTMDFETVDAFHYSDELHSTTLTMGSQSEGGWVFPLTFPHQTLPVGSQSAAPVVGGDEATSPIVRFVGPCSNPALVHDDWTLSLNGLSLLEGQWAEVDLRQWSLSATRNDGASVARYLDRKQWLEDVVLKPGPNPMTFRAQATGGGASCEVRWRSKHKSL